MRYTRQVLEVVCGVKESGNNVVPQSTANILPPIDNSLCFNVFKISNLGVTTTYSSPMFKNYTDLMCNNNDAIAQLSPGVVRCHSVTTVASGTGFAIAPDTIVTNWHVGQQIPNIIATSKQENRDVVLNTINTVRQLKSGYGIEKKLEYSGFQMSHRPVAPDIVVTDVARKDPVLGVTGNFDLFDVALFSVDYVDQPRVLFIPSASCVKPDSTVAAIGYPGTELLDENAYKNTTPSVYRHNIPNFQYLKQLFYGFGGLCASVGTVMKPYAENNNQWIEIDNFEYTPDNHFAIISNETVFGGNSGGPLVCLDDLRVHEIEDIDGNTWRLVEFVGIHTGGEFVNCVDCLHQLPNKRSSQHPSNLRVCPFCISNLDQTGRQTMTYNHSISVHHEKFVEMF
jgi:hypothetical protein